MSNWIQIESDITAVIEGSYNLKNKSAIGGGDINLAFRIDGIHENNGETKALSFFVKINHKNRLAMFEAEAAGLREMEKTQSIRVPHVVCSGVESEQSYLVLEHLELSSGVANSAEQLGQQLAALHKNTSQKFGWSRENTIGSTPQINTLTDSWIDFWRDQRLGFQLDLAVKNGASDALNIKADKLLNRLDLFFTDYAPVASLLHGDLWSGNYRYLENGQPIIFDPALYYGDREADIAMTELFGGFPTEFYSAYNKAWPLDKGYQQRKNLYNLYHILNHYNLFGGGYAMQAENMIDQLMNGLL